MERPGPGCVALACAGEQVARAPSPARRTCGAGALARELKHVARAPSPAKCLPRGRRHPEPLQEGVIPSRFSGEGSRVQRHAFQEKPESLVYDNRVTASRRIGLARALARELKHVARAPSPAKCLPRGRCHPEPLQEGVIPSRFSGEGSRVRRMPFRKSWNRWFTIT